MLRWNWNKPLEAEKVFAFVAEQVPNIKFNVAKMLERLVPSVPGPVVDQTVRPCLLELMEDSDVDVRFYAKQALAACDRTVSSPWFLTLTRYQLTRAWHLLADALFVGVGRLPPRDKDKNAKAPLSYRVMIVSHCSGHCSLVGLDGFCVYWIYHCWWLAWPGYYTQGLFILP